MKIFYNVLIVLLLATFSLPGQTQRNPVIELCTGTWCQWCPCGHDVVKNDILTNIPNAIILEYHGPANGSDPFSFFPGNSIISSLGLSSYPTGVIDRTSGIQSRNVWLNLMNTRNSTPATVSIAMTRTYNTNTRNFTASLDFAALQNLNGQFKFNAILIENGMVWGQSSNNTCTPGSTFLPNYVHHFVVRDMMNGALGEEVINGSWTQNQSINKTVNYTIPVPTGGGPDIVPDSCHVVVYVYKVGSPLNSNSEIQQAIQDVLIPPADPTDPSPPENFAAYSDYITPTSIALTWTDPTTLFNGTPITSSEFTIEVERDDSLITSVAGGTGLHTDAGLNDGQLYDYKIYAKLIANDSTSIKVAASWAAGGSPFPAAPANLGAAATTTDAVLTWTDPTTQADGTPLDDLDHINIYRDGSVLATVAPGVETYTDMPTAGFTYTYTVTAEDNETPANESGPSNAVIAFVGSTPAYLVWVQPDVTAGTPSEASGDSLFNSLVAIGANTFLTNNLYEFGSDLSIYDGVFVVLGIYSDNGILADPEGASLQTYLENGGRIFIEGGDCFNYDSYPIRPWFGLDLGNDGSGDLAGIIGLNDLSAFTFAYNASNNYMDELVPTTSTTIWQNNSNTDISGVFNVGFGGGSGIAIGVVPSFGGFVSSTEALNRQRQVAPKYTRSEFISHVTKPARIIQERTVPFIKKAAYFPELKAKRKALSEVLEIADGKVTIKANTQDDLMVAYLGLFGHIIDDIGDMETVLPTSYALHQNYPNPFNPGTYITYNLPTSSMVNLSIYNTLGQEVKTLVDNISQSNNQYKIYWNGKDDSGHNLSSGVYYYKLVTKNADKVFEQSRKMLLIK